MRLFFLCVSAALALSIGGCKIFDGTCEADDRECLANPLAAKGVGGACTRLAECKQGLYCEDGTCQPRGDTQTGERCRLTAECGEDDYCGSRRICQLAGLAREGETCTNTGNCRHGLVCDAPDLSEMGVLNLADIAELRGLCTPGGKKEQGERCDSVADCLAGLACLPCSGVSELECPEDFDEDDKVCFSLTPSDFELPPGIPPLWQGVACERAGDDEPAESYFEVPRSGQERDPAEFYSLPFPNDIRIVDGHIDLDGHPAPPDSFGLPFVSRYLEVASEDLEGFSTLPVVYFRFSHAVDKNTIDADETVLIVDITEGSPGYGESLLLDWVIDDSNYICPYWVALRPQLRSPLRPGTTYAAVVTTDVKRCEERGDDGCTVTSDFARGEDFDAMLESSAPSDPDLRRAWERYAPLRAWIEDQGRDADEILNAAVFTTQEPEAMVEALREQIHAEPPPEVSDLTVCESADTESPCATDARRRCHAQGDEFTEVHGRLRLPIFQRGTPPYLSPDDGGEIELDEGGAPIVQRTEDVCFAISVPAAPAPADGYPVLVFGHGTGGAFSDQMADGGLAEVLATGTVPAVLVAIDLPQHGARRGESDDEPEGLFYNFLNPRAARDNVLQGSADLMATVRWVMEGGLMVDGTPVAFDTARIALMGHSQGATHSALIANHEPDIVGVVLSGNGGHLSSSMLTKTSPVDIAAVVPIGLLDPNDQFKLAAGGHNPALAIIQSVFDRADPINYARRVRREPRSEDTPGVHLFMTYGARDTYSPVATQRAYAAAAGLPVVDPPYEIDPDVDDFDPGRYGLPRVAPPVVENVTINGTLRTIGLRQYVPRDDVDGHFVATREGQDGRPDVEHFLELLFAGDPPAIGAP